MKINPESLAMTDFDWTHVINPITDEELTLWLEKLRSGFYKPATNMLSRMDNDGEHTYCCLGVLSHLLETLDKIFDPSHAYLTVIDNDTGFTNDLGYYYLPIMIQRHLAGANDILANFKTVAGIIELIFTSTKEEINAKYGTSNLGAVHAWFKETQDED